MYLIPILTPLSTPEFNPKLKELAESPSLGFVEFHPNKPKAASKDQLSDK